MEMHYELEAARDGFASVLEGSSLATPDEPGIWRWRALLPPITNCLSLGEGSTPLLRSKQAGPALGLSNLLLKYEGTNPTGSYKDRFQTISMSVAATLGYRQTFCSSTGNHGTAAAAYARLADLECLVLLHEETPDVFDEAIACYGGTVGRIRAHERDDLMRDLAARGWFPATCLAPLPVPNPYGAEGYKTIAYELVQQCGAGSLPDVVVLPVGAGDGYYGVAKGFQEMHSMGFIDRIPRVFAIQPAGADPLTRAVLAGEALVGTLEAVQQSVALSIREASTGNHALRIARSPEGGTLSIDDAATLRAAELLASEGLLVDVASAAAVAGAAALARDGLVDSGALIVALLTASGARWPRPLAYDVPGRAIRGRSDDVRRLIGL